MEQNVALPLDNNVQLTSEQAESLIAQSFMSVMTQEDFDASVIKDYCVVKSGELYFDTSEQAESAVELLENWVLQTNQDIFEKPPEEVLPIIQIEDFQYHERVNAVTFQAFSETEPGIRQQLILFLDFCKTLKGLKKFDAPILQAIEPVSWDR